MPKFSVIVAHNVPNYGTLEIDARDPDHALEALKNLLGAVPPSRAASANAAAVTISATFSKETAPATIALPVSPAQRSSRRREVHRDPPGPDSDCARKGPPQGLIFSGCTQAGRDGLCNHGSRRVRRNIHAEQHADLGPERRPLALRQDARARAGDGSFLKKLLRPKTRRPRPNARPSALPGPAGIHAAYHSPERVKHSSNAPLPVLVNPETPAQTSAQTSTLKDLPALALILERSSRREPGASVSPAIVSPERR